MRKFGNILWGIVFIVIGLVWALNAMGITDISIFFRGWWTLFIIVPCGIGIFREQEKTGNIIGLFIGLALLLASNGWVSINLIFKLIVPFILVCIGLSIIFKDTINKKINEKIKQFNKEGLEEYYATFSGQKINMANEDFKGANLNAVFGGIELDLRGSIIKKEQIITASAIFGGIEIYAPADINVKVKSTPIFGGVSNKTIITKGDDIPTIYVNAFCLFGGVEIK